MKILKNKTYNQVLKTIEILITDKKKLSDKCDRIQIELNESNERVQKAEAERDELQNHLKVLQETHSNVLSECEELYDERDKLQSKLSRKGLGTKGKKKNNGTFPYDYNTEIHKKE